jgi:hypothetical protein
VRIVGRQLWASRFNTREAYEREVIKDQARSAPLLSITRAAKRLFNVSGSTRGIASAWQRGHRYGKAETGATDALAGGRSAWNHPAAARHRRAAWGDAGAGPAVRADVPPAPALTHPAAREGLDNEN